MPSTTTAAGLVLAATFGAAHAQGTVWRCGDAYSDKPCPGGSTIETPAAPDASQRQQVREAMRREARMADALEKDRLRREADAGRVPPLYLAPPAAGAARDEARSPEHRGTRKLDLFTATVPGSRPDKAPAKGKAEQAAPRPAVPGTVQPAAQASAHR